MNSYHHAVHVLLRTVMRAFYDPVHIVVMDAMLNYQTNQLDKVKESELAKKVNLQPSVVRKALNELHSDSLLTKDMDVFTKERATKQKGRSETYWRVDYEQCINAIRYSMYLLSLEVKKKVESNPTYVCTGCDEPYEAYYVASLLGPFVCKICNGEVVEPRDKTMADDSLEVKFSNQLQIIIEKLNECKDYVVPKEHRWNYRHIVTKEEADRKIEEQRKAIEREKLMGSHRPTLRNTQSNNLGATAHDAKASNLSSSSYISLDPSANIKIDFEERGIMDDNDTSVKVNPVQKKPDNPFFLKQTISSREYSDYHQENDIEDDDNLIISSEDKEINTSIYQELLESEDAIMTKADEFESITATNFEQDTNLNEPIIFVAGVPVLYSQITPEHESAMTLQEYEEYDRIKGEQIFDF